MKSFLLIPTLVAIAACAEPQTISVRVLNAKTGAPVRHKKIQVRPAPNVRAARRETVDAHSMGVIDAKTDNNGLVRIRPTTNWSDAIWVVTAYGNWTQCSPYQFQSAVILQSGVVARNDCDSKSTFSAFAKPSEIIVFTKHISVGEKLRHYPQ